LDRRLLVLFCASRRVLVVRVRSGHLCTVSV
jgi:hypothetical protein